MQGKGKYAEGKMYPDCILSGRMLNKHATVIKKIDGVLQRQFMMIK